MVLEQTQGPVHVFHAEVCPRALELGIEPLRIAALKLGPVVGCLREVPGGVIGPREVHLDDALEELAALGAATDRQCDLEGGEGIAVSLL